MSDFNNLNEKSILRLRNIVKGAKPKTITIKGKKYYINKDKIKYANANESEGEFLPLIPLILGSIAAAGSVAGGAAGVAKAVQDKIAHDAALAEQKRHNKNLEAAARGQGLEDVGRAIDSSVAATKQAIKNLARCHKYQKTERRF